MRSAIQIQAASDLKAAARRWRVIPRITGRGDSSDHCWTGRTGTRFPPELKEILRSSESSFVSGGWSSPALRALQGRAGRIIACQAVDIRALKKT